MVKILVVEDEYDIRELLQNYLENEGYQVVTASDGEQALEVFRSSHVDLILLDILLPRLNGYEVCRAIREESDIPIIMLTALDSEEDQLKGFDLRVDDYIPKPFSMPVLLRKIGAVLRRTMGDSMSGRIAYKALTLDLEGYKVCISGQIVDLTQREFELLKVLLQNQGRVLSRQALLNRVWSYDFYGDERIVDTHIKNLRKKLELNYIETIRGVGYRIDYEAENKKKNKNFPRYLPAADGSLRFDLWPDCPAYAADLHSRSGASAGCPGRTSGKAAGRIYTG